MAMERDIHSMKCNNTWRLVERPKDCNVVGCKWIFKKKFGDECVQYKARLVAQGFSQKYGIDYGEMFSPVWHTTLRTLFAISDKRSLQIRHIDFKTAICSSLKGLK